MDLSPEQITLRAAAMGTFLDSDTWREVVDRIEGKAWKAFKAKNTTLQDREAMWQRLQAFEDVQREFRAIRDRAENLATNEGE